MTPRSPAALLDPTAPALAKSLRALANALNANAFARLEERLRQLRNSLDHLSPGEQPWRPLVVDALERLLKRFAPCVDLPERLLALADLRAERHHYGLAILSLAEAASALACTQPLVDFEAVKAAGRRFAENLPPELRRKWHRLFTIRNRIAHGANLADEAAVFTEQSLGSAYQRCHALLEQLIRRRDHPAA